MISSNAAVMWSGLAAFFTCLLVLGWATRDSAGDRESERRRHRRQEQRRRAKRTRREERAFLRAAGLRGPALQRAILAGDVGSGEIGSGEIGSGEIGSGRSWHPYDAPPVAAPTYFPYGSWRPPKVVALSGDPSLPLPLPLSPPPSLLPLGAPLVESLVVRVAGRRPPADGTDAPDVAVESAVESTEMAGETYCPACLCVALERHDERGASVLVDVGDVASAWMLAGRARAQLCGHHERALEAHAERVGEPVRGSYAAVNERERLAAGRHVVRLAAWAGLERYGWRVLGLGRDLDWGDDDRLDDSERAS